MEEIQREVALSPKKNLRFTLHNINKSITLIDFLICKARRSLIIYIDSSVLSCLPYSSLGAAGLTLEGDPGEEIVLWLLTSLSTSAKREVEVALHICSKLPADVHEGIWLLSKI